MNGDARMASDKLRMTNCAKCKRPPRRAAYARGNGIERRRPAFGRVAVLASCVFVMMVLVALLTLPGGMRWYNAQELTTAVRHSPSWEPVVAAREGISRQAEEELRFALSWFGHDDLGRSLFFRVWPGFLVSLAVGLSAAFVAVVVGGTWGATSALIGGRVDLVMMRVVDVLYGLPYILMVILLQIALQRPLTILLAGHRKYADIVILFLAIGGVSWLTMARVVRGQVLSLRSQPFVEAARVAGAGSMWILRRHLWPNLIGPIATYATLVIPQAVLQESFLSFLGLGIQQPTPSLGRLAADGVEAVNVFVGYWWLLVIPCVFLVVTLLSLNFIGDGLRDAFDPKSKQVPLV